MIASSQKIAFIGLGVMGTPMARNLKSAGFDLQIFDANHTVCMKLAKEGFNVAANGQEACKDCDVVITILPTTQIVREVLLGENGAFKSAKPDTLFVDMSTGSYSEIMELSRDLVALGHQFVDAPVGRSCREAITGNLLVMAGGEKENIEILHPLFEALADTIVHVGALGTGLQLKLINNYMAMVNHVLTGEVLTFAASAGLDQSVVVDTLSETSAGKGQLRTNAPNHLNCPIVISFNF